MISAPPAACSERSRNRSLILAPKRIPSCAATKAWTAIHAKRRAQGESIEAEGEKEAGGE